MAKVKITGHASGSGVITVTAPNTSTDRTITLPDSTDTLIGTATTDALTTRVNGAGGRKNMIINGAMMIDQRNASASATTTASVYMVDRFQLYASTINNAQTYQQVADAPAGFNKSLKITNSSTAQAAGSAALYTPRQRIEGYNIAHLNWGTSDAQTVTISFWVKASVTGTYPLAINNGGFNRSFVTNYTVSVANTWEKKTATIAGDTSGTWAVDNSTGMIILFSLDTNSSYDTTAVDSWQSTDDRASTSNVHFLATASATWQITGVQLELGSVATDFEHRSYGEELALCERYYERITADASAEHLIGIGFNYTATTTFINYPYKQLKRVIPSFTNSGTTYFERLTTSGGWGACGGSISSQGNLWSARLNMASYPSATAGDATEVRLTTAAGGAHWFAFDAEL